MNKQNLWFFTLFSLILVLGVYYITMPTDFLEKVNTTVKEKTTNTTPVVEEVKEENSLVSMRVNKEEERGETQDVLKEKILDEKLTTEEKNNIYEELKYLNEVQGKEEELEKKLKKDYNLDCFIKIDKQSTEVICVSKEHDKNLANKIMRTIQNDYQDKMNITVKFQKT